MIDKKRSGNTNRRKGHVAERLYAKEFKALGYEHVLTSRYGSRLHDDAGIDLINVPFNVQVKAGKQKGMKVWDVIQYTKDRIIELFPKTDLAHKYPTIVIFHREVGKGTKRTETSSIVSMSFEDFKKIIKQKV